MGQLAAMWIFLIGITLSNIITLTFGQNQCEAGGFQHSNNICYHYDATQLEWESAETACNSYSNGQLAVVDSADIAGFIDTTVSPTGDYWIGLTKPNNNDEWITGDAVTWASWGSAQPDSGAGACVRSTDSMQSNWETAGCSELHPFVCEQEGTGGSCGTDWDTYGSSCYLLSGWKSLSSRSWADAQTYCESQGSHLAVVTTSLENTELAVWE
ncbi:unnamed protein product [Owenia fusiformis]|uniref:C-type lectin domain-containing protein n=1 Tax=Owenia fusiformis TaxID=6347 RepID=A0A8S4Q1I4_OWEFU|nr:unnamed protein product [Owenia fusiformis]